MAKKELEQSETRVVKRSQITLNPYNPKRHKDEEVKKQLANFKKTGYLGGIVFNEQTGHLVDGHRRIQAMDIFYKYDGSNDYEVKVEVVNFDPKTEKEQLTYMALGNTKADYNLVAKYAPDIDPTAAGLSDDDYQKIMQLADRSDVDVPMADYGEMFIAPVTDLKKDTETAEDIIQRHEEKPKMTKEQVKAEKDHCDDVAVNRQGCQDLYVFLSFDTLENKQVFCDMLGFIPTNSMMVKGEDVLKLIE